MIHMKKNPIILSVMFIALFLSSSLINLDAFNKRPIQTQENPISANSYDPIIINGSAGYNWDDYTNITGSGSVELPFIIEDFKIDCLGSGSGIFIKDSDFHVIIRNCQINNSGNFYFYDAGIRIDKNIPFNLFGEEVGVGLQLENVTTLF